MSTTSPSISRVKRSREQARKTYDRYSRWYDYIGGQIERKFAQRGIMLLRVQPGERVLEIGYGTGHMLVALAQAVGPQGHVEGIDISLGMYKIAVRRVSNAQMDSRVTLRVGDALTQPFPSTVFDAIFLSFTLELFDTPEIPVLLHQCQRLLKPNGRMGVVAIAKRHPATWIQRLYEALHHYFPQWIDCRPIYPSQLLQDHGFLVLEKQVFPMFGLHVELVTAKKR